ncbi:unnamed protein product [Sphenostylis stenocarpa]|uniref:non-specific serine/threonine protein kinase n=1 Tax=Sphenostylis stenocarpa TaxID=92480 RepID=A0AA86VYP7_9FABA|nr:unnamed protein product [Sphenostylis stenocarpa]
MLNAFLHNFISIIKLLSLFVHIHQKQVPGRDIIVAPQKHHPKEIRGKSYNMGLLYLSSYRMSMTFFIAFLGGLLIQAQDQTEFISIDCGAPADVKYTEPNTGIVYTSDANFITGVSKSISSDLKDKLYRPLWTVRSFPEGKRNCYKINITRDSKYLIRTIVLYGNYDGLNKTSQFDIHLGANLWDTVTLYNASSYQINEIIHVPSLDYVQICLVDTGHGTPFISVIELRPLPNNIYVTQFGSLQTHYRWDFGSNRSYRYKDDIYDRFWYDKFGDSKDWTHLGVSIPAESLIQSVYQPPAIVMSTAVTPVNASAPLVISWEPQNETDIYYVYMHFCEIEALAKNQTREFTIRLNGKTWYPRLSPMFQAVNTIIQTLSGISGNKHIFSLEMTKNSTLPPIINAIEIYRLKDFQQSDTYQGDVDAITTIKSVYGVKRDWQGDPCAPAVFLWDGLNCSYGDNEFPRITTLNLSSSGLSGKIDLSISKLAMLEKLDLSNNSLNHEVPDFLSELQHLKILNLEKNNLSGSIPSALVEKSKEGSLILRLGQNAYLCEHGQCNENRNNIAVPLVASICGVLILLVAVAAIVWILTRRKSRAWMVETDQSGISLQYRRQDDSLLQYKKQIYSYSDVIKITNNFNTILGKGGFGIVYLGYIYDTPVAVKILSPSSFRGYEQFQAEVKLLMRVHHKNLTSLIGYCNEGTNMSLIYEYMANGNLLEHLSGKHSKSKFLSWEDRLRIAVDAALGLEYLQNGCKPPIIHRDIKSTNILLNEHFQAKLSDFGLSKVIPSDGGSHVSTVVAGTPGYLDPDYYASNRLTEKSDVYSFGVVLLEIITGQQVILRNEEKIHIIECVTSLIATGDIKAIVDSRLEGDFDINSAWKAVEIAMACVSVSPNERPVMSVIVFELKETLAAEIARTKHNSAANSVEPVNVNLSSELIPLARSKKQEAEDLEQKFRSYHHCMVAFLAALLIEAHGQPGFTSIDCGAPAGNGTPFITAIELRILNNDTYVTLFGSLKRYNYWRCDLGSNQSYRYWADRYDRFWFTCTWRNWKPLNSSISDYSLHQNDYQPGALVMSTAVTPPNDSDPLVISWEPEDENEQFYVYLHFTELLELATNQTRQFNIMLNGESWFRNFSPRYLGLDTLYTKSAISGEEIIYSMEMTENSTLPPIISALEIYTVIDLQQPQTFQGDVDAITTIKSIYKVTKDWQGDPCAPVEYLWDGLNCSYGSNESPRITALDLSSSGLSGTIDPSISMLTMLEKLDLSNNNLNGEVPDFLVHLQHLKILNLEKNDLSGSIPSALVEKAKEGSLSLSDLHASVGQNPNHCESGQCNERKMNKIFTPIVASIGGFGTVYLGYIADIPVAVKMLSPSAVLGYQQFQAEVKLLLRVHHKNLTSLIGYCNEETNKGLIYEYMANGNLREHLSGTHKESKFLSWEARLRIAVDAALGLDYLQNGCKPPIIHRDVKSTNILLDEHFQAKLSDFGLSKILPTEGGSHVSTVVAGTLGYLDPHYHGSNRLTKKSDVYSFGVVLLEIITNQPVMEGSGEKGHISERVSSMIAQGDIRAIVDSRLEENFDINSAWKAVEIALACVSPNTNERPIMSLVVLDLKESLATELARRKHNGAADPRYSVSPVSVNLDSESMPSAR